MSVNKSELYCQYISIVCFSVYTNVRKCMFGETTFYVKYIQYENSGDHVGCKDFKRGFGFVK